MKDTAPTRLVAPDIQFERFRASDDLMQFPHTLQLTKRVAPQRVVD